MKMNKKALSLLLTAAMPLSTMASAVPTMAAVTSTNTTTAKESVISNWETQDVSSKPAARCWFPDAGAGADMNEDGKADYLDQVYDYIKEMYAGGFGSVELTWLNTNSNFDEADAKEVGWGTDAYDDIICTALDAANSCEDGFQIDVTITAHWPITINTVTPNDEAAAQSVVFADQQALTAADLEADTLKLSTATTWLCDNANSRAGSGASDATYIFKDTLVSTVLAKLNDDGTVDMDSLTTLGVGDDVDVDGKNIVSTDSWAVGIPGEDTAYIEFKEDADGHNYWDLEAEAPEDAAFNTSGTSTIVKNNDYFDDRETMADTQLEYSVKTDAIKAIIGDDDPANYVLLNTYYRGCGETCSGGSAQMMEGKAYVTDYFDTDGADAVLNYWNDNMLCHEYTTVDGEKTTMAELMKENVAKCGNSSIFEDSIELNPAYTGGPTFWTPDMLNVFEDTYGYDVSKYVYVMMNTSLADDVTAAEEYDKDFELLMGDLYVENHSSYISEFFKEACGYKYRAQAYELSGMLDVGEAAMSCDFGEGDNSTGEDGDRMLAAANILSGGQYCTNEALTFGYDEYQVWRTELKAMNKLFSEGISHIVLHGSAFNRAYEGNTAASAWPGWNFRMNFGGGKVYVNGFMSWGPKQPHWEDELTFANYVERVQSMLQAGQQKTNVAYISDKSEDTSFKGYAVYEDLLDNGYTYTPLTHGELESDYVSLNADGTVSNLGFRAIILNNVQATTADAMKKLAEFADAGVLIINANAATPHQGGFGPMAADETTGEEASIVYPCEALGTDPDGAEAVEIQKYMSQIMASGNYVECTSQDEIMAALDNAYTAGIHYDIEGLRMTEVADETDGTSYYMLYNGGNADIEDADLTFTQDGALYELDPAYGTVTALTKNTNYTVNKNGTRTVHNFCLQAGSIVFFAVSNSKEIASYAVPAKTTTAVSSIDLSENEWTVDLQSWGPDDEANLDQDTDGDGKTDVYGNPIVSQKITLTGLTGKLGTWANDNALNLTEEDLATLGVAELKDISGIATYTTTFTVPEVDGELGANLNVSFNADDSVIAAITVNGKDFIIDPLKDYVDLGDAVVEGENTITIKYTTSLSNRVASIYGAQGSMFGGGVSFCDDGLLAASVDLYTVDPTVASLQVKIEKLQAELKAAQEKLATIKAAATFAAKKVTGVKVKAVKKIAIVTWNKIKGADGYTVKYISKAGVKKATAKVNATVLKGLKSGKLAVTVKAYKKIGGVKIFSRYSTAKTVTIK